jgi:hypothetical protein
VSRRLVPHAWELAQGEVRGAQVGGRGAGANKCGRFSSEITGANLWHCSVGHLHVCLALESSSAAGCCVQPGLGAGLIPVLKELRPGPLSLLSAHSPACVLSAYQGLHWGLTWKTTMGAGTGMSMTVGSGWAGVHRQSRSPKGR